MVYKKNYRKKNYGQRRNFNTKQDRTKKLVDGKQPGKLESIAKNYVGPMGTIAKTVYGMVKLLNVEKKFMDASGTPTVSSSGTVIAVSLNAQGTTDQTRIGNSILFQDFTLRFECYMSNAATRSNLRILVICDKELDGALPTVANILQAVSVISPINKDFSKRFVLLKEKKYSLSITGNQTAQGKVYMKLPFHAFYDGATGAIGDAKENQILLLFISDEATNTPSINYYSRINFTDS